MDKVILYFNSTLAHFSQLITGLEYLKEKKQIDLTYKLSLGEYPVDLFRISYNGLTLIFDMSDNSKFNYDAYKVCDFYIKRMLLITDYEKYSKLIPYGLNYQIYSKNNFTKFLFLKNRKLLKYSMRYSTVMSKILGIKDCVINNNLNNMESVPVDKNQIIFRARLWNPENNEIEWKKKEREVLNHERITINRELKKKYGGGFKGGIQKDTYSIEQCPDLMLKESDYHKWNYLKLLKNCTIGIVNQGLEDSISWKMGEYISHSMAIITKPIKKYQLLGTFQETENYLEYSTLSECLDKTELLYTNDKLRKSMQKANQRYYNEVLHPGMKLKKIFSLIENSSDTFKV
tara:strand:- start:9081 stop:10115 length:1035 start_codon:yes stop_codon:yes gene_type:complete